MLLLLLIGCLAQAEEAVIDENVTVASETEVKAEEVETETSESQPSPPTPPTEITATITVQEDANTQIQVTVTPDGETQISVTTEETMKSWDETMEMLELIKQSETVVEESENESE